MGPLQLTLGLTFVTVSVTCIVIGCYIIYSQNASKHIMQEVAKETRLENGTEQYDRWKKQSVGLKFKVYLFNVTNPDEIVENGATPIVREIGPFVYEKHFFKKEIINKGSDILQYNQYLKMKFRKDLSLQSDGLIITFFNMLLHGVSDEKGVNFPTENETTAYNNLQSDDIFSSLPIKDLEDTFCNPYRLLKEGDPTIDDKLTEFQISIAMFIYCNQIKDLVLIDPTMRVDSNRRSMFDDYWNGQFQISAGLEDISSLGEIRSWNGRSYIESWAGGKKSKCNILHGTDSTIYAPGGVIKRKAIFTFNTEICRTIKYSIQAEVEFKGIPGLKAVMGPENMANDGENSCYCIKKTPDILGRRNCFPKGFCDMGNCLEAPIVLSLPHMLWADKRYSSTIKGLAPKEDKHMSFILVDPITGTLLQSRKRMQYNIPLRPVDAVTATKNFQPAMLPVLWVEEDFDLPNSMIPEVRSHYIDKVHNLYIIGYVLIGSGIIGTAAISVYLLFPRF
ncbi:CD36 family [Popillia japonica]|uniref:Sensory neuron membrane protein 2 n=1 Tax=Popillia japonica TaxID=7064 RepID=A0AAW1I8S5_POPJA